MREKDWAVKATRVAIGLWVGLLAGLGGTILLLRKTAEYGQKRNVNLQFLGAAVLRAVANTMS
jgi:hypothetical protein